MESVARLLFPKFLLFALLQSQTAWCALVTYGARDIDQNWTWVGATRGLLQHNGGEVLQAVTHDGAPIGYAFVQTGYIEYVATFRLKLFSASLEDSFHAGFSLSGFRDQQTGQPLSRNHSIYIIPGEIGILPAQSIFPPGPKSSLYSFEFVDVSMAIRRLETGLGHELAVYINQPIENILNRSVPPVLARSVTDQSPNGMIAFGDNDLDANSYYMMQSVTVEGITVPEPASACSLALGGILTVARRRHRNEAQ